MTSAKVKFSEVDLSTRVPSFPGVFGGIVIQAKKGPLNQPTLVTNDSQLLNVFTPKAKVDVGFDNAYFSALSYLEKSDKLWVVRAAKDALFSGASVKRSDASTVNQALPTGFSLSDPDAYAFDSNPDVDAVAEVTSVDFTDVTGATADVAGTAQHFLLNSALDATQYYLWLNVTDGGETQTDPAVGGATGIQVDILAGDDDAAVAGKAQAAIDALGDFGASVASEVVTITNAAVGATTDASQGGTPIVGLSISVDTQGVTEVDNVDELFLIHSANEGAWGDDVGIKIIIDQDIVKEPDAFIIQVFTQDNQVTPIETHTVSRIEGKLDGFGQNIFIETVLESSNYIRVKDNSAVDESILPLAQATVLFLNAGDNGLAVTDSEMITASDTLANKDDLLVTVLMDGGFTSVAYQQNLEKIANLSTGRGDAVAILSTPFADEASASFLTDILDFRKTELNLNSSYAALYSPHVKILDRFNNRELFIAPDGIAAGAISFSAANFEVWFPPAGFKRGNFTALDLRRRFTSGEMDALQADEVNPLRFVPGKGLVVWGQHTLLSRPSALRDLNVRLLLIAIEPGIQEALEDFLFELNDEATRSLVTSLIESFLADIQSRRGLTDFSVVSDSSNNSAEDIDAGRLNIDIFIKPARAIKEIPVRLVITATGLSFEDAAAAISG